MSAFGKILPFSASDHVMLNVVFHSHCTMLDFPPSIQFLRNKSHAKSILTLLNPMLLSAAKPHKDFVMELEQNFAPTRVRFYIKSRLQQIVPINIWRRALQGGHVSLWITLYSQVPYCTLNPPLV